MEQFFCSTNIVSGPGSLSVLAESHIKRLFIVSDPFFFENGTVNHIAHISGAATTEVFARVAPDPSVSLAAEGTRAVKTFQPDTVLALGGGSAMDCAKAMVYFSGLPIQLIAVPTTSGSGSEVTNFAILTHNGVKHPLVDDQLRPDMAILDSNLLTTLPRNLIADGGFDLISHAVESWAATGAGRISDSLAADALNAAFSQLPKSFAGDSSARQRIHTAATMAGMAFSASGLGLCHAISHALGGEFHTPHGRLNAILLPAVLEINGEKALHRYAALSRQLGLSSGADVMAMRSLRSHLLRLRRELQLPETLAEAGIPPATLREKLEAIVSAALEDPCCATNPVKPEAHHVRQVLHQVMGHG